METQKKNRLESHRSPSSTRHHHHHHHHLHQAIVEQIMIKLPTKSILRFKCVSKSWRSLASSDRFIKAHLEKSTPKHESLERHHMTFENYRTRTKKRCSLPSLLHGHDDAALVDLDDPTCAPEDSITIVGSCNGLLCILKDKTDFILWNPTTRKFRSLPPIFDDTELNHLSSGGSHLCVEAFGFGSDESDDDFKVFGMWRRVLARDGGRKLSAKIYSSKTDSWRRVDDPVLDRDCLFNATGRFASGKLYWEAYHKGDDEGWRIISFDLEKEAFRAVEWPGGLGADQDWRLAQHAIDGLLCCFNPADSCTRPDHVDYWVLEDGPCWRRLATLGCPRRRAADEIETDEYFHPLMFVGPGDSDILAEHNGSVVVFAKEEGGGGYSGPTVLDSSKGFEHTSIYVESLVEP